ncbi:hypothetical protein DTO195F2_3830 [Paecilomyces variotii]|nr:hypothetical protein DTO195F2_3830 [Paecilomyces variotii]
MRSSHKLSSNSVPLPHNLQLSSILGKLSAYGITAEDRTMSLTRADFDNPAVRDARNPSTFGYHHGPIPYNNDGWLPPRQQAARDAGIPAVTAAENAAPPNAAERLSGVNGHVCDVVVDGSGLMCGVLLSDQPSLRRHIRNVHPGAILNASQRNLSLAEELAGHHALKKFVLTKGWREARYHREPGSGAGSLLEVYATACERIASEDPDFAATFGTKFHREPESPLESIKSKRRRRVRRDNSVPNPPSINVAPDLCSSSSHSYDHQLVVQEGGKVALAPSSAYAEDRRGTTRTCELMETQRREPVTPGSGRRRKRGPSPPPSPPTPTPTPKKHKKDKDNVKDKGKSKETSKGNSSKVGGKVRGHRSSKRLAEKNAVIIQDDNEDASAVTEAGDEDEAAAILDDALQAAAVA